jgi:hypothetical protein
MHWATISCRPKRSSRTGPSCIGATEVVRAVMKTHPSDSWVSRNRPSQECDRPQRSHFLRTEHATTNRPVTSDRLTEIVAHLSMPQDNDHNSVGPWSRTSPFALQPSSSEFSTIRSTTEVQDQITTVSVRSKLRTEFSP